MGKVEKIVTKDPSEKLAHKRLSVLQLAEWKNRGQGKIGVRVEFPHIKLSHFIIPPTLSQHFATLRQAINKFK